VKSKRETNWSMPLGCTGCGGKFSDSFLLQVSDTLPILSGWYRNVWICRAGHPTIYWNQ